MDQFSIYAVWDNISSAEIKELEGLFRHIYRYDTRANQLNRQRAYKRMRAVRTNLSEWIKSMPSLPVVLSAPTSSHYPVVPSANHRELGL